MKLSHVMMVEGLTVIAGGGGSCLTQFFINKEKILLLPTALNVSRSYFLPYIFQNCVSLR